ncbi:MAG: transcriptional regulator [Methyloprofundus sp.]|nr:MAG: transcriptional regulator [Methyloprofundus sp.]
MYIPEVFAIENKSELYEFISQWSFGDLITTCSGELFVNHVPFVVDKNRNKLYGHLAVNNPQLAMLESADDLLVAFKGANAYVSPSWYISQEMVPTWNFEVVQVSGKAKLVESDELLSILQQLTDQHERQFANSWCMDKVSEAKLARMLDMIVGFEIEISTIKGKSKLSQNRSVEDQIGVISGLQAQQDNMAQLVADKMELNL